MAHVVPVRRRLFALAAVAIMPLAVMTGIGISALHRQHVRQSEVVGLELARSVANAVDAELRSTVAMLETLVTTPTLDREDVEAYSERIRRVLQARPDWAGVTLRRPNGELVHGIGVTRPDPAAPFQEQAEFDQVVRRRAPSIGNLVNHPAGGWLFAVRAPVFRDGELRYVIAALVRPDAIRALLTRQRLPPDWVISIVDDHGRRVARSSDHDATLGGALSPSAQEVVQRGGAEGVGLSTSLEGDRILTPYSTLEGSGWVAVLGIPTAAVDAAASRTLTVYAAGVLLSILLGVAGAAWVAGTITRPIAGLREAAAAVGRNESPAVPPTSIQEIRDVGATLAAAARDLADARGERENLLNKERIAREAAEAADRSKDQFMAVLSHELRTPLNAVYGWARMLQSGQLRDEPAIARAKDAIVRNADVQVKLIDDLLDLSRITTGKMRIDQRRVALGPILGEALDSVRPAADAKLIRVHSDFDADAFVHGDPARLQQVVWNLLMNALKFTPGGGEVTLRLDRQHDTAVIIVRDTGRGIPADVLPHVFERFRQADSSSTRTHGGLGLGLTLVKHLVELHGGSVTAESPGPDRGATFTVTLPIADAERRSEVLARAPAAEASAAETRGLVRLDELRVLAIDDDRESLTLAQAILVRAGANVMTAASAAEGMALFARWRPDVVVSDLEMPDEDGYGLIGRIRALPIDAGGTVPAIALSAYGSHEHRRRAIAAGFTMHVPKPVDPSELTAVIAEAAQGRRVPRTVDAGQGDPRA